MGKLLTLSVSAILLVAFVSTAFAQLFAGSYRVSGTSPTGETYDGTVRISISKRGGCRMQGVIESISVNTACFPRGHNLKAAYRRSGRLVRVVYELTSDGSLNGSWTIAGTPGRGHEVLTPYTR